MSDGKDGGENAGTTGGTDRAAEACAPLFSKTTAGVTVDVEPMFLESQSFPELGHFVWAYRVRIRNGRAGPVRLTRRYWRITDKAGSVREVEGEGVVGETPLIQSGLSYEYTSGAPLATPSGLMSGRYLMVTGEGEPLEVEIPAFSLDSPHDRRTLN